MKRRSFLSLLGLAPLSAVLAKALPVSEYPVFCRESLDLDGNTVSMEGRVFRFSHHATGPNEIQIGKDLAETVENINKTDFPALAKRDGGVICFTAKEVGPGRNSI